MHRHRSHLRDRADNGHRWPPSGGEFHGPKILGIEVAGINGAKGFVTADPPGVTCANEGAPSAGCQYSYPPGALVTLTANAAPGDVFLGWADACTGEDTTCDVVIDDTFVTATFARPIIVASRIAEKYGDVQERSDGRIQSKNKNLELSRKRSLGFASPCSASHKARRSPVPMSSSKQTS